MDNGFILCEPIRVNHQYHNSYSDDLRAQIKRHIKKVTGYAKYKLKYINKPDQLELTTPENYYEEIYNYAVEHGHHFAGLKETYDHSRPFILESILTEPYDIHLFSFRDPLATFNSWKQKKQWWKPYKDVSYFVDSYLHLYEQFLANKDTSKAVVHEPFCIDTLSYRNKRVGESPLKLNEIPNLGDKSFSANSWNKKAIYSERIEAPVLDSSLLSTKEKALITSKLDDLYQSLLQE